MLQKFLSPPRKTASKQERNEGSRERKHSMAAWAVVTLPLTSWNLEPIADILCIISICSTGVGKMNPFNLQRGADDSSAPLGRLKDSS